VFKKIFSLSLIFSLFTVSLHAEREKIDFSMVISGGVSLGAYEAGYNWAMIKMLSKIREHGTFGEPQLRSVAGASAGSINALMTAMYWCQKDSVPLKNSVENNLFYETWVNLGIEDLAIMGEAPNKNKSTLFTRKPLEKKAAYILEQMNKPIFRKGCEVPLGVSVTKVIPIVEEIAGIKIKNQHFSIPFSVKEKDGKLMIENKKMPPSTDFYISIPGIERNTSKITNVLFASSAFPGAFQQVKLDYVYKGKRASSYFIDGGAYDNVPLQLAIELNPKASFFLFMDPSNMRKEPVRKHHKEEEKPPVGFLETNAIPLLSSLEIFQSMRLYQAINQYFRNNDERTLILSSRYHPITGKYLEHFAAFLDKNFRTYDYYVGVYDAIYHLAESLRKRPLYSHYAQTELMDKLKTRLGLDENPEALSAYTMLRDIEFKHIRPKTTNRFSAIYNAFNTKKRDAKRYNIEEFKAFLTKLDISYLDIHKNSFLAYVKKDVNNWYKRPFRAIINRVTSLENDRAEVYKDYTTIARTTTLAAWAMSTFVAEKDGWDILPLHVPQDKGKEGFRTALRLLPGELATDMKNGGVSFGYTALYYANLKYLSGFEGKAAYVVSDRNSDFVRLDLDAFYEYDDFFKFGVGASGFGDVEGDFYKRDSAYGFNTYVDFMDIFRFTYVRRHGDLEKNDYIYFGIENLPALIYWLNR
jgi:predicted acylesterase/phospholipase RssA